MSWYKKGDEGKARSVEEEAAAKARAQASQNPSRNRFWLAPNKSAKVTFLDSEGFFFREHQLYLNGSWLNWETCLSDLGEECPPCEDGRKYAYVAAFTIIDHSTYKDKKGNDVKARKKIIVLKAGARNKVLKQKERRDGDLRYCMFEISRFTEKECSTGEDFEFVGRVNPEELKELCPPGTDPDEWLRPFNYEEIFKPKTPAELRKALGIADPVGSKENIKDPLPGKEARNPFERKDAPSKENRSLKELL